MTNAELFARHTAARLKRKEAEKKKKKAERDKKREIEKKKEETHQRILKRKREKYKPIHVKNLRRKQNARAYKKRRKAELEYHRINGDVYGWYRIVLCHNYEQVEELSSSWWMLTAYEKYNSYIEKNHEGVICEKVITQSDVELAKPVKNEILLLKKIDPDYDDGVRQLRNEIGVFQDNIIVNNDKYAIIAKEDWYIPETYNVYGYNPSTDRKTGRWIYDNIINVDCCRENIKNIFMCDNKLIIQYDDDLDFVMCKNSNECLRLYNRLHQESGKNKYLLFTSYISPGRKQWLYNAIEKKTGWTMSMIQKNKS